MRAITLMVAICVGVAGCAKKAPPKPPPPTVIVSKPLAKKIVDWDDFVGRFEAIDSVDIRPRVSGYLKSIGFTDGQVVRKGQVLFVIDPRPYQAALDQAKGQEARAVATLANARIERARAERLYAAKAIAEQEYETRLAAEQQAAADLVAARATTATAALNLSFTRVTAPQDGLASDRRVAPGNLVTQDTTILTNITDLNPIRFSFYGAESLYLKYQRQAAMGSRPSSRTFANPVEIRLQDQPNFAIRGRMDFVDNTLDANSGTIRGRALVDNPKLIYLPGLFGHLRLLGSGAYQALLIPDDVTTTQQSDTVVYVVGRDGKIEQRKITEGPLVDGLRVVTGGLKAGDDLVIDGLQRAKVGVEVKVKQGRITPPDPGASPTPADLAPPAAAGTYAGQIQ
ncbi:efflux RND transporter periplasmic adaptor subunit [Caulobacter sp. S45]|uniref:efflux RND transporter periplasmic adaptor subunit n=1 Tax=Caulobacter sp. S45 TaxID=1641861 RepID=UPI001576ED44|nr:efflux RND transporter periplasmic adaptor subunit [Caulobacter sp. S45]